MLKIGIDISIFRQFDRHTMLIYQSNNKIILTRVCNCPGQTFYWVEIVNFFLWSKPKSNQYNFPNISHATDISHFVLINKESMAIAALHSGSTESNAFDNKSFSLMQSKGTMRLNQSGSLSRPVLVWLLLFSQSGSYRKQIIYFMNISFCNFKPLIY